MPNIKSAKKRVSVLARRKQENRYVKSTMATMIKNFREAVKTDVAKAEGMLKDIISPLHILYIDIIADTIPSIALAFEKNDRRAMLRKPNGLNRRVFTPFMIAMTIGSAIIEAGISLAIFFVSEVWFGYEVAMTLTLLSVVLTELTFTYNCKELKETSFRKGLFGNKVMNISTLIIFLIQIPVFFTSIGSVFGLVPVTVLQFAGVVGITILGFFIMELMKPLVAKAFKDK